MINFIFMYKYMYCATRNKKIQNVVCLGKIYFHSKTISEKSTMKFQFSQRANRLIYIVIFN